MEKILKLIDESNVENKEEIKTYLTEQELMIRQLKINNAKLVKDMDKLIENIKEYENILVSVEEELH